MALKLYRINDDQPDWVAAHDAAEALSIWRNEYALCEHDTAGQVAIEVEDPSSVIVSLEIVDAISGETQTETAAEAMARDGAGIICTTAY